MRRLHRAGALKGIAFMVLATRIRSLSVNIRTRDSRSWQNLESDHPHKRYTNTRQVLLLPIGEESGTPRAMDRLAGSALEWR
jgi:hypothetical protein